MSTEIKIKVKSCPLVPIDKLEIIQGNLKELSKAGYDKLKGRIARLGFDAPIFVWKGKVLDGTQRIRTVQKMIEDGFSLPGNKLPIVEILAKDLNEAKERLLGYISQFGKVTDEGLYEFVQGLDIDFDTLDLPDFNMDKFKVGWFEKEVALTDEDAVPELPKKAKSKRGQIYQLGRHKVMCGDSTCRADVDKLMGGKRADMVFTDPPYGINWNTDYSNLGGAKTRHKRNKFKGIQNDDVSFDPTWLLEYKKIILFGANYYSDKLPVGGWLIWDKSHDNGKFLFSQAEGAWTNIIKSVRVFRHKWQGHDRDSERGEKTLHPTQKPVQVISDMISIDRNSNAILDPFLGSGSTLIACEKTNRICFGIEIDPIYVDVIIKRWEDYVGKRAIKI